VKFGTFSLYSILSTHTVSKALDTYRKTAHVSLFSSNFLDTLSTWRANCSVVLCLSLNQTAYCAGALASLLCLGSLWLRSFHIVCQLRVTYLWVDKTAAPGPSQVSGWNTWACFHVGGKYCVKKITLMNLSRRNTIGGRCFTAPFGMPFGPGNSAALSPRMESCTSSTLVIFWEQKEYGCIASSTIPMTAGSDGSFTGLHVNDESRLSARNQVLPASLEISPCVFHPETQEGSGAAIILLTRKYATHNWQAVRNYPTHQDPLWSGGGLLRNEQFGFRPKNSTALQLTCLLQSGQEFWGENPNQFSFWGSQSTGLILPVILGWPWYTAYLIDWCRSAEKESSTGTGNVWPFPTQKWSLCQEWSSAVLSIHPSYEWQCVPCVEVCHSLPYQETAGASMQVSLHCNHSTSGMLVRSKFTMIWKILSLTTTLDCWEIWFKLSWCAIPTAQQPVP